MWLYVNLVSLAMMIATVAYITYKWHIKRQTILKKKDLSNKVLAGLKHHKSKKEIKETLKKEGYDEEHIEEKIHNLKNLVS